ncbi:MAG: NVEALA domain-containing protein [Paludibacteraceae bacterium]|nr:NVEALA domain-containing protein [Bacteroidaceae bacterium]MBR5824890.1 NVEALA domain-containing protein [Paludibacteraceae bacterium]
MKSKFLKIVFVVAVAMIAGVNVFNAHKPIELSDIAMANVEALAQAENPNSTITGECWESIIAVVECYVVCPSCLTIWYPDERKEKSTPHNVSGKCGKCGNTSWTNYN